MFLIFQKQSVCFGHSRILYAENSNANEKHQMRKQMQRLMHSCQYVVNKILLLTYDSQCAIWYRKVSVDHVMNGSQ